MRHIHIEFEIILPDNDRADYKAFDLVAGALISNPIYMDGMQSGIVFEIKIQKFAMRDFQISTQVGEFWLSCNDI